MDKARKNDYKNKDSKNNKTQKSNKQNNKSKNDNTKNIRIKKTDKRSSNNIKNNRNTKFDDNNLEFKKKRDDKNTKIDRDKSNQHLCPYAKKCGGCDYQDIDYSKQLAMKQEYMKKLMKPFCKVNPIVGMDNPFGYRHKVHAAFGMEKRGKVVAGIYEKKSHRVVDVERCLIEDEEADVIIRDIKSLMRDFKIKAYDEDTGYGLLRHVLIRKGYHTKEIMVVLVLVSPILPSKNNFVKALRKLHPNISTVVVNVNDKRTSMVLGDRNITVFGKGYIVDKLCGLTFKISPNSFYQVNPKQTELLYEKAIEYANLSGDETVIDAYCGTGTIGLIASKKAGKVIGVELNKSAIKDAVENAKHNDVHNEVFYCADAGEFMVNMASEGKKADLVIMDPPRSGSDEAFLSSVIKLSPKKIVYVSCGPDTLARDLTYLTKNGYRAIECTPFDCFPNTSHIESVVLLSRSK